MRYDAYINSRRYTISEEAPYKLTDLFCMSPPSPTDQHQLSSTKTTTKAIPRPAIMYQITLVLDHEDKHREKVLEVDEKDESGSQRCEDTERSSRQIQMFLRVF